VSQALDAFGLLNFTMLVPFSLGTRFETLLNAHFFNFPIFSGRGKTADTESVNTRDDCLCTYIILSLFCYEI
jgi:hypothetical protein